MSNKKSFMFFSVKSIPSLFLQHANAIYCAIELKGTANLNPVKIHLCTCCKWVTTEQVKRWMDSIRSIQADRYYRIAKIN